MAEDQNSSNPENITTNARDALSSSSSAAAAENRYLATAISAFGKKIEDASQPSSGTKEEGTNICPTHNAPLNFWSDKDQVYQCIKCLINAEEVHYIDYSYKRSLEEFKKIKEYGMYALNENAPMAYMIKEWKDDIRDMLQRVHQEFI